MAEATAQRTLVVANRTASTPMLLKEVARRSGAGASFALLIPPEKSSDAADWTPEDARRLVGKACGEEVECIDAGDDAGATIKRLVEEKQFDAILLSTEKEHHARWLHHDLPHRVQHLGVAVTVIPPEPGWIGPIEGFPPEWGLHAIGAPGRY